MERNAGIERVVYCHGSFAKAMCTRCGVEFDGREIKAEILAGEVPRCRKSQQCDGVIKPCITFFNEPLSEEFHEKFRSDARRADLLLVMGTSLSVAPVSYIPMILRHIPSIFINVDAVPGCEDGVFDYFLKGPCDQFIDELLAQGLSAQLCGESSRCHERETLDSNAHIESTMEKGSAVSDITPDSSIRSDESDVLSHADPSIRSQASILSLSSRSANLPEDNDKSTPLRNRSLGAMVKVAGLALLRVGSSLEGNADVESEDLIKGLMRGLDKDTMEAADLRDLKRCIRRMIRRRLWSTRSHASSLKPMKKSLKKGGSSPNRRREKREILYPQFVAQML